MLHQRKVQCPYCGENFDTTVDASGLDDSSGSVQYTEDCYVCCRPIVFSVRSNNQGELVQLTVNREDE